MMPLPINSFIDWANSLRLLRPDIEINYIVNNEDQWREYADRIAQSNICQTVNIPRHNTFASWQDWASQFIKSFGVNT